MKKYWKSIDEYKGTAAPEHNEAREIAGKNEMLAFLETDLGQKPSSRRDFLKFCGFSVATAAVVSSCKNPVNKAIPYLIQPEEVTPGKALHYASTFYNGKDYCGIVVKVRDGRPIKIEGNELCPMTHGGTSARVQASILNLYDSKSRYKRPYKGGNKSTWDEVDADIIAKLEDIRKKNGKIVLLTNSVISPSTSELISDFKAKYSTLVHISYDPVSASAILEANMLNFEKDVIPAYHFDKADIIVGFNADFLGTWLSPIEYAAQYATTRALTTEHQKLSEHHQFESTLSLTGSNADYRHAIKPSDEALVIVNLYNEIAAKAGMETHPAPAVSAEIKDLAGRLWANKGKSLVVSGSNDINVQLVVNAINHFLGSYGTTISFDRPLNLLQATDKNSQVFIDDLGRGLIQAVLVYQANPVYDHPQALKFTQGLAKAELSVSFASSSDETAKLCQYVCPDHHYLEAWNDTEPRKGTYTLAQPMIQKLYNTRSFQDSLLKWTGKDMDYYQYIKVYWEKNFFTKQNKSLSFNDFWSHSLQAGIFEVQAGNEDATYKTINLKERITILLSRKGGGIEFSLYESIAIGSGIFANNPWLQELPDPVSKVTWDNYAAISAKTAAELGIVEGDIIKINDKLELPVLVQPGQTDGCISAAIGYGRTETGKVGNKVGGNVYPFVGIYQDTFQYYSDNVQVTKTGKLHSFAQTQTHHSMEGRPIIRETVLPAYLQNPSSGNELHDDYEKNHPTLYPEVKFPGHHWGVSVDFNTCIGCSACVIACQAENNIPVIGKDEVRKKRIMHWIRIDRYYTGEPEKPSVVFQPLMCQHCDNAPCENVCPVAATTHSNEGLNQMAYNRCIGTKYCINNCPYKVRRFNWFRYADNKVFDYGSETDLGKMVLNPDVVVRERGVVEKCTFCVQRIQDKKLQAKLENRPLNDGEILPACVQSCPTKALVFGDLNNPESKVSGMFSESRRYHLLEDLHTLPKVGYLTKVRNRTSAEHA